MGDETGRIALSPKEQEHGTIGGLEGVILTDFHTYEYIFTESDAGKKVVFACDIGSHCEEGHQIIEFVVGDAQNPAMENVEASTHDVQTYIKENVEASGDDIQIPIVENVEGSSDDVQTQVMDVEASTDDVQNLSQNEGSRRQGSFILLSTGLGLFLFLF